MPRGLYFDSDYLRRRIEVHKLSELGHEPAEISRMLDINLRNVTRYLRMTKPIMLNLARNQTWRDDAACSSHDTEMFFPSANGARARILKNQAIEICKMCPVINQCREAALANYENDGVWGGMDFSKVDYEFNEKTGTITMRSGNGSVEKIS